MRRFLATLVLLLMACSTPLSTTAMQSLHAQTTTITPTLNVNLVGHLGGQVNAVAVQGTTAYAGIGNELVVVDISDPAHPRQIGHVMVADTIQRVAVAGSYAYLAPLNGDVLRIIDISNPTQPAEVGTYTVPNATALDIAVVGSYAYVTDDNTGLRVLSLANPASPTQVGFYSTGGRRLTVANNYVYLLLAMSLQIIDVTNPTAPTQVSHRDLTTGGNQLVGVAVSGNYVYAAASQLGVFVLDVSNSSNPVQVGFYALTSQIRDVTARDSYAYVVEGGPDADGGQIGGLRVVDVSQPSVPTEVGFLSTLRGYALTLGLSGHYAYIANGYKGLTVVDISNSHNPTEASTLTVPAPAKNVAVMGSYAYVVTLDGLNGQLHSVNIANPASPTEAGYIVLRGAYDLTLADHYAYVSGSATAGDSRTLHVIDVANPAAPVEVGSYSAPRGICARGAIVDHYLYLNCGTIRVVDIANPATPHEVGSIDPFGDNGGVGDLAIQGQYAYVTAGQTLDTGVAILDISSPTSPKRIGELITGAATVATAGNYAYVGYQSCSLSCDASGVQIVNVSDPATPTVVSTYPQDPYSRAGFLTIAGNYLYLSNGSLQVIDVSDPASPRSVGSYNIPDGPTSTGRVAVAGNDIYLPSGTGLYILSTAIPAPVSISGRATDVNGMPFAGVTITTNTGAHAVTDANGLYTLTNIPVGTYTLTPTLAPYSFTPPQRTLTASTNITGQNFTVLAAPVSVTLRPGTATTLTYTDTQGLPTTFTIPANAVSQTSVLVVTPTIASGSGGYAFAGHAFDLELRSNGVTLPNFTFGAPITVAVHYSTTDLRVITDEAQLHLWWQTGSSWQDAAQTCSPPSSYTRDTTNHILVIPICRTGVFALMGPSHQIYLPMLPELP